MGLQSIRMKKRNKKRGGEFRREEQRRCNGTDFVKSNHYVKCKGLSILQSPTQCTSTLAILPPCNFFLGSDIHF